MAKVTPPAPPGTERVEGTMGTGVTAMSRVPFEFRAVGRVWATKQSTHTLTSCLCIFPWQFGLSLSNFPFFIYMMGITVAL